MEVGDFICEGELSEDCWGTIRKCATIALYIGYHSVYCKFEAQEDEYKNRHSHKVEKKRYPRSQKDKFFRRIIAGSNLRIFFPDCSSTAFAFFKIISVFRATFEDAACKSMYFAIFLLRVVP